MLAIFCAYDIYVIIKHNIVLKSRHITIVYDADIIILYACKCVYVCISCRHYSYTLADSGRWCVRQYRMTQNTMHKTHVPGLICALSHVFTGSCHAAVRVYARVCIHPLLAAPGETSTLNAILCIKLSVRCTTARIN